MISIYKKNNLLILENLLKNLDNKIDYIGSWNLSKITSIIYRLDEREADCDNYSLFISLSSHSNHRNDNFHARYDNISLDMCKKAINIFNEWINKEKKRESLIQLKSNNPFSSFSELSKQYDELEKELSSQED